MDIKRAGEIFGIFGITGEIKSLEHVTIGHINDTYDVSIETSEGFGRYILQRVNTYVFKDPKGIMRNIDMIAGHINDDVCPIARYLSDTEERNYVDAEDGFWRVSPFVKDSVVYDSFDDPEILKSAGCAFGKFQNALSDFPANKLTETIPGFHDTKKRLQKLDETVKLDPVGRAAEVKAELDYINGIRGKMSKLCDMLETGEIPLRVTHNDTKTNNVLFLNGTKEPAAVIDLDTVMPGLSVNDFGDAIRYAANTAAEDEKNLSKVQLDMQMYTAFAEGFLGETAGSLRKVELDNMALGAFTMTAELVVRFLEDYIAGDKYFKTAYPEHNLVRTRCQLKLADEMLRHFDEMQGIADSICARVRG